MINPKELGLILKEARTDLELSLSEVSEETGCTVGVLRSIESGQSHTPSVFVIAKVVKAFGLSMDHLFLTDEMIEG